MVSPELKARVDAGRGDVPRERWLRRAVERALDGDPEVATRGRIDYPSSPAPAEQPGPLDANLRPGVWSEQLERLSRSSRSHAANCKCPVCS